MMWGRTSRKASRLPPPSSPRTYLSWITSDLRPGASVLHPRKANGLMTYPLFRPQGDWRRRRIFMHALGMLQVNTLHTSSQTPSRVSSLYWQASFTLWSARESPLPPSRLLKLSFPWLPWHHFMWFLLSHSDHSCPIPFNSSSSYMLVYSSWDISLFTL